MMALPPLYIACQQGHLDVAKALITAGADINQACNDGATPLYIACQHGHLAIAQALITAGADINQACNDGATPLYIACQNGHLDVVNALIKAKANVNLARITDGATPLYIACQQGHLDVAKALITAGANVNLARIIDGVSPLWIACCNARLDVAKALIKAQANVNQASINGATPLSVACLNGHTEIARLLKARAQMNALDEASLLQQFRNYASSYTKQFFLAPLLRFFHSTIGNHFADIVRQALLQEKNPTLHDFLGHLKAIAVEKNINLRAYRSGELNALLNLSDMVLGENVEQLKPANPCEMPQGLSERPCGGSG